MYTPPSVSLMCVVTDCLRPVRHGELCEAHAKRRQREQVLSAPIAPTNQTPRERFLEACLRYAAAACQTDLPCPRTRADMAANTDRMIAMIDAAVIGSQPFLPVRLVVFPEFAHAAPAYATVEALIEHLAVPIPNAHTDRLAQRARQHDIYIQSGSMIEVDARWPGVVC